MKTIRILYITVITSLLLTSCNMEDRGNYKYISKEDFFPVKIADFKEDFAQMEIIAQEKLYYEPTFEEMDDLERYTYCWYTLHRGPDLRMVRTDLWHDYILDVPALELTNGQYELYLEVKDPKYDLRTSQVAAIRVQSSAIGSFGIYILKEEGANTDVDYHKFNIATEAPAEIPVYENLFSSVLREDIAGKPVDLRYYAPYVWQQILEDGSSLTQELREGAWFVMTDQDIVSIKADMSMVYKRSDDHFYSKPSQIKPQYMTPMKNSGHFLMNDNQVYGISTMFTSVGRFAEVLYASELKVSDAGMVAGSSYLLFFEELSGLFAYIQSYNTNIVSASAYISPDIKNRVLITNRLVTPVKIMDGGGRVPNRAGSVIQATMILRHKTEDKYYMTRTYTTGGSTGGSPFEWIRPIDAEADIIQVPYPVMSSSYIGNVIYYAKGNELWMYMDGGDTDTPAPLGERQVKVATLGAGETIANIGLGYYNADGDPQNNNPKYDYAWVTVTTNTADGKYKFYAFENIGTTPELNPEPVLTFSGNGKATRSYIRLQYGFN